MQNSQRGKQGKGETSKQADDADFLVEEFDLTERDAAGLVARDGVEADEIKAVVHKKQARRDPLAGVPSPERPASDLTDDTDEERLKPVVGVKNHRSGGG